MDRGQGAKLAKHFVPRLLQGSWKTVRTVPRFRTLAEVVDSTLCHDATILWKKLGKLVQENKKIKDCNNFSDSDWRSRKKKNVDMWSAPSSQDGKSPKNVSVKKKLLELKVSVHVWCKKHPLLKMFTPPECDHYKPVHCRYPLCQVSGRRNNRSRAEGAAARTASTTRLEPRWGRRICLQLRASPFMGQ